MTPPRRSGMGAPYGTPALRVRRLRPGLVKVVVLHEHRWVAPLVAEVLSDVVEIVGATASGEIAVRVSEVFRPDVVVASDVLADGVVDNFLARLIRTGTRVIVLAETLELSRMLSLAERGVTGFVDGAGSPGSFATALLTVAGGGAVFPPALAGAIAGEWRVARRGDGIVGDRSTLTAREIEILGAMVDGMATKAVAHLLGVSAKTVENHKTRIFSKLGVRTQTEAVSVVLEGRLPGALTGLVPAAKSAGGQ